MVRKHLCKKDQVADKHNYFRKHAEHLFWYTNFQLLFCLVNFTSNQKNDNILLRVKIKRLTQFTRDDRS